MLDLKALQTLPDEGETPALTGKAQCHQPLAVIGKQQLRIKVITEGA